MIYIVLFIFVLSIIAAVIVGVEYDCNNDLKILKVFVHIFILIGIISFVMICYYDSNLETAPYKYPSEPTAIEHIVALSDNSEINGTIRGGRYLTRGYVNEQCYYSYMVALGDGGIVQNKVPANGTTLYEVDNNFRVEWYEGVKDFWGTKETNTIWKIYIPEGSITSDFVVDLQ